MCVKIYATAAVGGRRGRIATGAGASAGAPHRAGGCPGRIACKAIAAIAAIEAAIAAIQAIPAIPAIPVIEAIEAIAAIAVAITELGGKVVIAYHVRRSSQVIRVRRSPSCQAIAARHCLAAASESEPAAASESEPLSASDSECGP